MARATFINAILSGKLGGTVYAHNKAGPYVRQYSIPTNPNTLAQADARNEFASAVTLWQAMNAGQKAAWNSYASAYYKAKHDDPTVLYSGFNAFVGLCNASRNGNRTARVTTAADCTPASLTIEQVNFECSQIPPVNTFSADITTNPVVGDGVPLAIGASNFALQDDGIASFDMTFEAQTQQPLFICPTSGMAVGYVLYASNIVQQEEQFVTKPNLTIIGTIKPPTITLGWTAECDSITWFFNTDDFDETRHKLWYATDDVIRMELWALGQQGPLLRIGQEVITIADVV